MNKAYFFRIIVPKVKRIIGISDLSLFRKKWSKRIGKLLYHKKYCAADIVDIMCQVGMGKGSVVCVHASMMQFYNYRGTAKELIDKILEVITPEGTLIMPAFPVVDTQDIDSYIFDPFTAKTGAGHLAETFRKYPGVIRSNNVHHSVCAIGKYAEYLTCDHTKGCNCWDEYSPWYRMCQLNALVFNLGLPRSYIGTFHHCVEGLLYEKYPYWSQFLSYSQKYRYKDKNGEIIAYNHLEGRLIRKTWEKKVTRYFTVEDWQISHLSNLEIKVFYSKHALDKMIELGRRGISVYYIPSSKGYKFN